ncbi:MAG: DUF4199 domain-containing protein [Flavobacteriales bacterium]|nr:DUF4199 domain-containing protein [Flavobacteriales bacterium]MCB9334827.1 DUF4199 domain-containing protein [Flavobacteriales bacterium]
MFKNPFQVAVTFAVVALIVKLIIFSMNAQHGDMETYIRYIYMLILLTAVFFGIRSNKINAEQKPSFGQDFKAGARTASFFAIIVAVITYVYYAKIDTHFFELKKEPILQAAMEETTHKLKTEGKEAALAYLSNQMYGMNLMLGPYFQAMTTMMGLVFMGLFNSVVFAFLMKKMPGFKQ